MCYHKNNDEYEYYCYTVAAVVTLYQSHKISCHNFVFCDSSSCMYEATSYTLVRICGHHYDNNPNIPYCKTILKMCYYKNGDECYYSYINDIRSNKIMNTIS